MITYHIARGTQLEAGIVLNIIRKNLAKFVKGDLPLRNQIDKKQGC